MSFPVTLAASVPFKTSCSAFSLSKTLIYLQFYNSNFFCNEAIQIAFREHKENIINKKKTNTFLVASNGYR